MPSYWKTGINKMKMVRKHHPHSGSSNPTLNRNVNFLQSFTYDAHDKIATALNETDGYDLNGNETSVTFGGITYHDAYDDEDRLLSVSSPTVTDTFTYNGLGQRVAKTDTGGTSHYLCDGASPGAPVLWDGAAVYTPGLSEHRGSVSSYYDFDQLGNLWTVDSATGKSQYFYQDTTGFGNVTATGERLPHRSSSGRERLPDGRGLRDRADGASVLRHPHRQVHDARPGKVWRELVLPTLATIPPTRRTRWDSGVRRRGMERQWG